MMDNRWPEPRPALELPSRVVHPNTALPWYGRLSPTLPREAVWFVRVLDTGLSSDVELELTLDLRWGRVGCTRRFELGLHLHDKADQALRYRAVYSFHPTDQNALVVLAALSRQAWWHLILLDDSGPRRVLELANTLDLPGLLRDVWAHGP